MQCFIVRFTIPIEVGVRAAQYRAFPTEALALDFAEWHQDAKIFPATTSADAFSD